jgi:hypothetical protein
MIRESPARAKGHNPRRNAERRRISQVEVGAFRVLPLPSARIRGSFSRADGRTGYLPIQ